MKNLKAGERNAAATKFVEREMKKYICCHGTWNAARIMEIAIRKLRKEIDAIKKRERGEHSPRKRRRVPAMATVPGKDVPVPVGADNSGHGVKNGENDQLSRECPP